MGELEGGKFESVVLKYSTYIGNPQKINIFKINNYSFPMTGRKGIDRDGTGVGEEVEGAEGGETLINIYFI